MFTKPYIVAHTLSRPTWRYAYCLYVLTFGVLVVWSILSQLGKSSSISACFRKLAIRRLTFSGWSRPQRTAPTGEKAPARRIKWASPTVAQLVVVLGFVGVACALTFSGDDYVDPDECVFGGTCSQFSSTPQSNTAASGALPNGWAAFTDPLLSASNVAIRQTVWTAAARMGLMSYALLPLCVTLALKQWPFNIWATPFLTNYGFDKTAILHRWSGRIIWLASSGHVAAWFVQLARDKDPYGRAVFYDVWSYYRFVAGMVAYVVLCVLTLFSFGWFRNRYYEFFYWSHVGLVIVFCVFCCIHHVALMAWPVTALAWWGGERLVRFGVFAWVNGFDRRLLPSRAFTGDRSKRSSFVVLGAEKVTDGHHHQISSHDWSAAQDEYKQGSYPPTSSLSTTDPSTPPRKPKRKNYFAFGPAQDSNYTKNLEQTLPPAPTTPLSASFSHSRQPSHNSLLDPAMLRSAEQNTLPNPGFARAQLLPGRTVRLTIHTPRAVRWLPGQHVFLTIPSVGRFEAHPYTIASIDERAYGILPMGGHAMLPSEGSELVLVVRAQKGFSRNLWRYVEAERKKQQVQRGIELRALVSWPLGSAGRVDWGNHDSLVIICGGTGVTFGISVLEYACRRMARRDGAPYRTTRVRFVWILREFAHLSWVAPTLRRCLELSDPAALQVELYVSRNAPRPVRPSRPPSQLDLFPDASTTHLLPPSAPFLRKSGSRESTLSLDSEVDVSDADDTDTDAPSAAAVRRNTQLNAGRVEEGLGSDWVEVQESVTDMICFEGEDDERTAGEEMVSAKVRSEGKLRRALSRRQQGMSFKGRKGGAARRAEQGAVVQEGLVTPPGSPRLRNGRSSRSLADESRDDILSSEGHSLAHSTHGLLSDQFSRHARSTSSFGTTMLNSSTAELNAKPAPSAGTGVGEADDAFLDLTEEEHDDLDAVSELARTGYPRLGEILDDEVRRSRGKTMVACCGPNSLNTTVRHLVSDRIDVGRILKGDARGQVSLVCEDFAF